MMTLASNKQKMFYSLQNGVRRIYEKDEFGNTIYYKDESGNKIPLDTGETATRYTKPVEFTANITNRLNEDVWKDYGIDESTNYAQIIVSKGSLPLKVGSLVWKQSEVGYLYTEKLNPSEDLQSAENLFPKGEVIDETTADYVVKGVANEGLSEDLFLLKRIVK